MAERPMRRRALAILLVVFAVVAATAAYAAWPRGATPVTREEALADFRSRPREGVADPAGGAAPLPAPGVYTYAASGQEVVKVGVLPAETRPYPSTMTVVVVRDDPSCYTSTLNLIDQHTEDTTYCLDSEGRLRIAGHEKRQKVGALSPTASMTCDPGVVVTAGVGESALACNLSLSAGPAQLSATLNGAARVTEGVTVMVGGDEVAARRVELTYDVTGGVTGTWVETVWFAAEDMLPLRIERQLDLDGLAAFDETSTLNLTDTTPAR